ncbi:hypothetical protein DFH08DRAFT_483310 [Mycena albidolilacea]|uniref:Uncharacterized protein n=1 Tax=Mycena albidolilacea TaxID=1033008 RepID=A0AAD7EC77_9AGAR|nr:hypothetical protein DFH08DRAFT_483310 [Mycena albidolilacea]
MPPVHHASPPLVHSRPWSSAHTQERLGEEVDREIPRCAFPAARAYVPAIRVPALRPRFGVDTACGQAAVGTRCGKRRGWKKNRKRTTRDWVVCPHRARVLPCGRAVLRIAGSPLFISPPAYLCWTSLVTLHLGAARDSSCCTKFGTHDNDARVYMGMADTEENNVSFAVHVHRDFAADTEDKHYDLLHRLTASRAPFTRLCGMPSCSAHSPLGGSLSYPRGSQGRIRHPHFLLAPSARPSRFDKACTSQAFSIAVVPSIPRVSRRGGGTTRRHRTARSVTAIWIPSRAAHRCEYPPARARRACRASEFRRSGIAI